MHHCRLLELEALVEAHDAALVKRSLFYILANASHARSHVFSRKWWAVAEEDILLLFYTRRAVF